MADQNEDNPARIRLSRCPNAILCLVQNPGVNMRARRCGGTIFVAMNDVQQGSVLTAQLRRPVANEPNQERGVTRTLEHGGGGHGGGGHVFVFLTVGLSSRVRLPGRDGLALPSGWACLL